MSGEVIEDLIKFLNNERLDLRNAACSTVLNLTGSADGIKLLLEKELLCSLLKLIHDSDTIAKTSFKILINISSERDGATALFNLTETDVIEILINCIQDPEYTHADFACGVLANLTRLSDLCPKILAYVSKLPIKLEGLVFILCQIGYNKKGAKLDLLAPVISNFTQSGEGRRKILNKEKCIFVRLLPFTDYSKSKIRRKAIISAIHNCCFEKEYHEWLLSDDIDIASRLALPLAGPDTFTPEENESLPLDLQFLPDDKCREDDPEVRTLLLESLMRLCTTRNSRETLRKLNIYLILREHHKWEKNKKCLMLNEDVVNMLIKTEEEIGEDDLSTVEIPSHLIKKFSDFDMQMLMEDETK